jgi:hypothetical protein
MAGVNDVGNSVYLSGRIIVTDTASDLNDPRAKLNDRIMKGGHELP